MIKTDLKTETKFCTKCNQIKSIAMFSKNRATKDGFQCWCKTCINSTYKKKNNNENKLDNLMTTLFPPLNLKQNNKKANKPCQIENVKQRYSPLEEQFLKINYSVLPIKELAIQLNRTELAIKQKLYQMELIKETPPKKKGSCGYNISTIWL
jgi:hypothetical protein